MLSNEADKRPTRTFEAPLPLTSVNLITPLEDPTTGHLEDVVVKSLTDGPPYRRFFDGTTTPKHTRYISGLDIQVPWPEGRPIEYNAEEADTLRIDVEDRTFVPTLMTPPMPLGIIDELRNKYSKYRIRHEPEYVARKEAEAAGKRRIEWFQHRAIMPLKQLTKDIVQERELEKMAISEKREKTLYRVQVEGLGERKLELRQTPKMNDEALARLGDMVSVLRREKRIKEADALRAEAERSSSKAGKEGEDIFPSETSLGVVGKQPYA